MTRYTVDAPTVVRLVREGVTPAGHQLVGPAALKSNTMALLYAAARSGDLPAADAKIAMRRLAELKVRLLGDRMSRATAWKQAERLDWDDTAEAEYIAVTVLQADALVTENPRLIAAADGVVPIAAYGDLLKP